MFRFKLHRCVNDSTLIERFLRDNDLNYVPVCIFFSSFFLLLLLSFVVANICC